MGCDVMLFRKEYISYDKETKTHLIKQQNFWSVKSSKLGIAFAETLGADTHHTFIPNPDNFVELCKQMIAAGEDDFCEYPDGALKAVIEDIEELNDEAKYDSDWFITLDY